MDATTRRPRGGSFHEEVVDNFRNNKGLANDGDGFKIRFMTPQFESNNVTEAFGPPPLIFDDDNEEDDILPNENSDDQSEEFAVINDADLSRGRSRSRSMHSNDDPDIRTVIPVEPKNIKYKASHSEVGERYNTKLSGPLQNQEVQALQQGLVEVTLQRDEKQILEEEEERRAAEEEKKIRTLEPTNHHIGGDLLLRKIKILMLGDSFVGKSSLVYRFTLDDFSPCLTGTVGVDFKVKRVVVDGEPIQLQVWDTAGQEQFHRITQTYYKGAHAIMLVYDVTDIKTLQNVEYWMQNINSHSSENVQVVLVANKIDLRDGSSNFVDTVTGLTAASKHRVTFFETSAKTGTNVEESFMTLLENVLNHQRAKTISQNGSEDSQQSNQSNNRKGSDSNNMSIFRMTNNSDINDRQNKKKSIMGWLRKGFK